MTGYARHQPPSKHHKNEHATCSNDEYYWTLVDTHPTQGRTFRRRLDMTELSFLWDGRFNGATDSVEHIVLRGAGEDADADSSTTRLFSSANVTHAWLATKRRYPLAGAIVAAESTDGALDGLAPLDNSSYYFVVREADLDVVRPGEIVFGEVKDAEEAQTRAGELIDHARLGARPLSEEMLVRMYVTRETGRRQVLHVVVMMAHCVTDRMGNATFMRCFLDTLAREASPLQVPLEERLAALLPAGAVELEPAYLRALSPARRRWRKAIGLVIFELRVAKMQGGHTLPCRLTRSTPHVPARSCRVSTTLTPTQSATVVTNCRLHNITFGNAFLVLAQAAMSRVLFRRYLRGEISEAEWEYRKKQPHISGGPLNLRSYLNKTWFENGGGGEFMLAMSLFYYQLPFMTLGVYGAASDRASVLNLCNSEGRNLLHGAPSFSELLSFDRFLHRVGLVKRQTMAYMKHPLILEIVHAVCRTRLKRTRSGVLGWMKRKQECSRPDDNEVLTVSKMRTPVWAHSGSSIGDVDAILPSEYPLLDTHSLSPYSLVLHPVKAGYVTPTLSPSEPAILGSTSSVHHPAIIVESSSTRLHARPGGLYLVASTFHGHMHLTVFYDGNVFEEDVVEEWLNEMKGAVLWYLGRTHSSRSRQSGGDNLEQDRQCAHAGWRERGASRL